MIWFLEEQVAQVKLLGKSHNFKILRDELSAILGSNFVGGADGVEVYTIIIV